MEYKVDIKPLSVNECWQGRRFKTPKYKKYESDMLLMLPALLVPPKPYRIVFEFGLSNHANDIDNSVKPFMDILQKRYLFNDRDVMEMLLKKVKVEKGKEYIYFKVETWIKS